MKTWRLSHSSRSPARLLGITALIFVALMVAGCGGLSRPAPVKAMYLLEPAAPSAVAGTPKEATLRIGSITVAAPFRGRALVYRRGEVRYETDFYSEFFVSPSAMLSQDVARTLTAAKVFRRVVPPGAAPEGADYLLDGFATELYGDLRDAGKPAAALAITFYLSTTSAINPDVIWSKEYRRREPAADASPDAMVRAWNTALSSIMADLARDLAAVPLAKP